MFVTVLTVTLLIGGCGDMELPLGAAPMSLPGLSYVAAAAEQTLSAGTRRDLKRVPHLPTICSAKV